MARPARLFAQIDVHYFEDDRVLEAGNAWQLHLAALLACKRMLTDGVLTRRQIERIAPESLGDVGDAIGTLIRVGLFEDQGSSIRVRSWADWNDSAADIEAESKNGKRGNHVRWHVKRGKVDPGCAYCADRGDSGGDVAGDSGGESKSRDRSDVDEDTDLPGGRNSNQELTRAQPPASRVGDEAWREYETSLRAAAS